MASNKFIGYPEAVIYEQNPELTGKKNAVKKTLWGDSVELLTGSSQLYQEVKCRGVSGWTEKSLLQDNQILEINFIDVGQGDGVFVVTPKNENILIDAGAEDNMYNFLSWRFNLRDNPDLKIPIENLIITHSDLDHYGGFIKIINSQRFEIKNIFHNGIVERTGTDLFGKLKKINGENYITEVFETKSDAALLLNVESNRGSMKYPNMLYNAIGQNISRLDMLSKGSSVPGYGSNDEIFLKVLAPVPVVSTATGNKKWLKYFGNNTGKAKNGNSVVMMLNFGKVKILLGGDLNEFAERYLTIHYTGFDPLTVPQANKEEMLNKGRSVFACDVAKSCHHGSHYFLDDFLRFIYPAATVISSGDNESYTHPRPETLGALGKSGRGDRPMIFSTELARSAKDKITIKEQDIAKLASLKSLIKTETDPLIKQKLSDDREKLKKNMERVIAVYGMINLRTDGKKIILAQKKEEVGAGFEIFKLEPDVNGELKYTP